MSISKRKSKRTSSRGKRRGKKSFIFNGLKQSILAVSVLLILILCLGVLIHNALKKSVSPPAPLASVPEILRVPIHQPPHITPPIYEVFPKTETPPEQPITPPKHFPEGKPPKVAIIIDDMGYNEQIASRFIQLKAAFTFSILPFSPHERQVAQLANENGIELMLHLPMEPDEYPGINPGPGALLERMSPDVLLHQLNDDLDAVPYIKGVNNHMGSRLTASSDQMNQICSVIKRRHLFFIDSKTTPKSKVASSARLFHVPYAERDVFLDNVQDADAIRKQVQLLIQKALRNGYALAIGHPHKITCQVLQEELPELNRKVQIVPASELVHSAG